MAFWQSLLSGIIFVAIGIVYYFHKPKQKSKQEPISEITTQPVQKITFSKLPIQSSNTTPPSERQIQYATSVGICVPHGCSSSDVSAMLSRYETDDYELPSLKLVEYAQQIGVNVSPYIGKVSIIGWIFNKLNETEKCAFYAYAVYCSKVGCALENINKNNYKNVFTEFSNIALNDRTIFKSIIERDMSDFYNPSKSTNAYKAATVFLLSKGII